VAEQNAPVETKDTVPLWLAVAITVCVSLPFGVWLGDYNLPIWASFIVWAEYFALGAKPAALKIMVPAYILGAVAAGIIMTGYMVMAKAMGAGTIVSVGSWSFTYDNLALFVACFIGFCIFIYAMKYVPVTQTGSLPYFNGISMMLAVFFTGAFVKAAPADIDVQLLPAVAAIGAILAGLLGAFLGWFNVVILFTHPVKPVTKAVSQGAGA
jgi:hypothetical protein